MGLSGLFQGYKSSPRNLHRITRNHGLGPTLQKILLFSGAALGCNTAHEQELLICAPLEIPGWCHFWHTGLSFFQHFHIKSFSISKSTFSIVKVLIFNWVIYLLFCQTHCKSPRKTLVNTVCVIVRQHHTAQISKWHPCDSYNNN